MLNKVILFEDGINSINYKSRRPTVGPELDLANEFISSISNSYNDKNYNLALFIEPKIISGYPDIVMVEYHPRLLDYWVSERNKLSFNEFTILSILSKKRIVTFNDIVDTTHLSSREVLNSTEILLDCKMINRNNKSWSLFQKRNIFALHKVSAVEAKINNWQSALHQASLNIGYANESFILSNVKNPKSTTIAKVKQNGVGIYNMKQNNTNIICDARKFPMATNQTVWQLNEWIGRKIYGEYVSNAS